MKILKYTCLTLFATACLGIGSCNLDETIKDTPTPGTITSESDVNAVIEGMYSRFNDSGMFKFLGAIMLFSMADDIYTTSGSEYAAYGQRTLTSANTAPMWNNMYATIANANNLIDVLDNMELSEAFEKRAYGEAHFIRAFAYYYLVRLYGGVPLRLQPTTIESDFYLPRNTVDEVYTQIFMDFKAASERLPLSSAVNINQLGRATKGAAQAILAQAYLTYGNQLALKSQDATPHYTNSALYADSVISSGQYSLLPDYGSIFDVNRESDAYKEIIFGIRFTTDPQARAQPAAGSEFASAFNASNTRGTTSGGAGGDNVYRVSHWFADYYRTGDYTNGVDTYTPNIDYRNEKAFHQRGFNNNNNRYFAVYPNIPGSTIPGASGDGSINDPILAKYQDPGGKDNRNHGNDFIIIRYAEVQLIKAEALNELSGPTAPALAAFNEVRRRARSVNGVAEARAIPANLTTLTAGSKDNFRMKIFDERGLELVGEGQRWFDLVRMRSPLSPTETMYKYQFKDRLTNTAVYPRTFPTFTNQGVFSNKNAVYARILAVEVPKFLLFPIPATELIQNARFGPQNPGW